MKGAAIFGVSTLILIAAVFLIVYKCGDIRRDEPKNIKVVKVSSASKLVNALYEVDNGQRPNAENSTVDEEVNDIVGKDRYYKLIHIMPNIYQFEINPSDLKCVGHICALRLVQRHDGTAEEFDEFLRAIQSPGFENDIKYSGAVLVKYDYDFDTDSSRRFVELKLVINN